MDSVCTSPALCVRDLMEACDRYAEARMTLESRLDDDGVYGSATTIEARVSCAVVAAITGGAASASEHGLGADVLTPDGRAIAVWHITESFIHSRIPQPDPSIDEVAIVSWLRGRPVAVHFVGSNMLKPLLEAMGCTPTPFGMGVDSLLHCNLTMEPLLAEVYGVRSVPLEVMAKSLCRTQDAAK